MKEEVGEAPAADEEHCRGFREIDKAEGTSKAATADSGEALTCFCSFFRSSKDDWTVSV